MPVFGYVQSRRLGRSLGINNVKPKYCSYSCVYCQLGRTKNLTIERTVFYDPYELITEAERKINDIGLENVDFVTFVSSGEPTLDVNLGMEIDLLKEKGCKVAVITNSSLITRKDVFSDLLKADLVSLKVDAVDAVIWKKMNRPHPSLKLQEILKYVRKFGEEFSGELITETMFIQGINDKIDEVERIAEFLRNVNPKIAYIGVPTRPPAERVCGPDINFIKLVKEIFEKYVTTKLLIEPEKDDHMVRNLDDVLKMAQVHPVKETIIKRIYDNVEDLKKEFTIVEYKGERYYFKKS